jgi:UDP-N-acetylglucosamine--N-acetylmuramyl-(pentapeptide) pyrophosphoryl-undecaprenol N-acetylglucosamine transferase
MPEPALGTVIAVSGGHLTPALATIEYIQKHYSAVRIIFIGRRYSQAREGQIAREAELCQALGIPFFEITAAKFHRQAWWRNWEEVPLLIPSLWQAWQLLRQNEVKLFLSFGGYLAVPIALMAKLQNIKVVTHEQTSTTGLANQLIAWLADRVAVSSESSLRHFPKHKTTVTGNPIRSSLLRTYQRQPTWMPPLAKPLLYITGGSQGSQVINNVVGMLLNELTKRFVVIHQCGSSPHQHYLRQLEEFAAQLPPEQQARYAVREWVEEREVSWLMQHALLLIGRSGANTTQEVMLHALPAIFIPLPFSHRDEQTKNALLLVKAEAAVLLEQKHLTPEVLWDTIVETAQRQRSLRTHAVKLRAAMITDGARRLTELCFDLLPSKSATSTLAPITH